MNTRVHPYSPLPAPIMHAGAVSIQQSKSHVLAGVQDAYWSDEEVEDAECPLCLEEMDISDINFKPCPCGYQICRFCWHHIKENLNGRCPACRREYTDEAVQFKPINKEDHKRLTQQKKQRERERKELEALNRRHLANVRVVQRNVVYVVGLGPRFAKEELIPTLRSTEYFGQYGKISKIVIVKRTPSGSRTPVVGLYITYHRREDAARCIAAVDGASSPGGNNEIMRASHGTTKYCMAFLRGVSCPDHSCMSLHEWGDESDCFTKEDLTTLKHTMKDTESRARTTTATRKADETDGKRASISAHRQDRSPPGSAGLPRAASWANKGLHNSTTHTNASASYSTHSLTSTARSTRRTTPSTRTQRSGSTTNESKVTTRDRKPPLSSTLPPKPPSLPSSSRPATPASASNRPLTPGNAKSRPKESIAAPLSRSPPPESEVGSASQGVSPPFSPEAVIVTKEPPTNAPTVPPGVPAVPPGLTPPPGLPHPSRLPSSSTSSPQVSVQPSQSSYQMSTQAQALVEDIRARRESSTVTINQSPFPDFDRMLQALSGGDNGFSFTLDPKLAVSEHDATLTLPELEAETASTPYTGSFLDIFPGVLQSAQSSPALGYMAPPGLSIPQSRASFDPGSSRSPISDRGSSASGYTGSFNPFASEASEDPPRRYSPLDEERKVSRFGFARGRQGSSSSPLHAPSPLGYGDNMSHTSFFSAPEATSPVNHAQPQWNYANRPHQFDYTQQPSSVMSSPLAQHSKAQSPYALQQQAQPSRFQPFDNGVSEAQLRDLISSSRDRLNTSRNGPTDLQPYKFNPHAPFADPAIMSASPLTSPPPPQSAHNPNFASPSPSVGNFASSPSPYGPPPGLVYPPGIIPAPLVGGRQGGLDVSQTSGSAHVSTSTSPVPSPALSQSDFPALAALEPPTRQASEETATSPKISPTLDDKEKMKAEKKAAKKAAAAERAAERQRLAQEKAVVRAAEKERIAQEKAVEKERAAAVKAEKEEVAKKKAEEERIAKEKAEKERSDREKVKAEKERLEKEKKELSKGDPAGQAKVTSGVKGGKVAGPGKGIKRADSEASTASVSQVQKAGKGRNQGAKQSSAPPTPAPEPVTQAPILARMPKKNKPISRPIKIPKEDPTETHSSVISAATSETPGLADRAADSTSNNSRSQSVDMSPISEPTSLEELFCDIDTAVPWMHVPKHPFFDMSKVNPAAKMPLEYGPLVHALSALSVGGGSFANNMPSGSIDNAVSSFQQLLETLTQTISDLLRLLPRTTWDDSSSFDGVLRDMLKGDDFLDGDAEDQGSHGKEDEVAALTQALERRARWMEVQLSKLEELHRDINTAAVRAVLSFNDNGWDNRDAKKPGNSLQRFDRIGWVDENGKTRLMTTRELEEKLEVAKDAARLAEADLREAMLRMQEVRPLDEEEW